MAGKILIVDDEPNITLSFSSLLKDSGYRTDTAGSVTEALTNVRAGDIPLVLLDLNLPDQNGLEFLRQIKNEPGAPLVLVISGQSDIATALEAVRLGAVDYLEKPVSPEKLISSVKSVLMLSEVSHQRNLLVDDLDSRSQLIGDSRAMKVLVRSIIQIAPSDSTVLITGENGTGKELVATRIYLESKRREKPFIKVNCPGIPPTLFESELFGHARGAFTGAVRDYPGKFALASEGTIFLDEIGDLPVECQAKLLRVLETGEVETLGSAEPRQVDVRVICATNRDLIRLVNDGNFREDLYYRISVLMVEVPPLRRRLEDIPILVGEFLRRFDPGGQTRLSAEAIAFLTTLDYPGNVRQLKNMVERLTILFPEKMVEIDDIQAQLVPGTSSAKTAMPSIPLSGRVRAFEKQLIKQTLDDCQGNISAAARKLGLDRGNLSKKIKDLDLKNG